MTRGDKDSLSVFYEAKIKAPVRNRLFRNRGTNVNQNQQIDLQLINIQNLEFK
jgi:hypothetical protein